ncbi:peptidoglycan DD-metalloendopeptidase family protein [Pedobacter sp. HMF7647]|uniref:Peptidoglycan DD-metalloendopeptidase family protein n=1 Tax=Hufsiella arboris TaxID=2695275 RepID=A0A7K1YEW5_9SPHI|nr:M23 family metallopeptidase [Hufsiella arboris]MXV52578.1 peptidoglycan DD-metalloendopeptidase family protein [Hufsiella arboris]
MRFLFIAVLALVSLNLSAQDIPVSKSYPQDYFSKPLELAPSLAGSFGEIRGNHFHSGLDYRTNQREGYPVYAPADGYVSRLRVQIGGGGNIVYLTHPNGYSTVYMHLQRFNERILQALRSYQYRQQQYDVDFPLLPIEIPVKKGEIIAWSGRTGAVAGPHLHFEIRDSKTEETINAQLFGLKVPDISKPTITSMYVYRLNGLPFSPETPKQYFQVVGSGGNYHLNQSPVINISGETGFGINTFDMSGGSKNGVYSIELSLDGKVIYLSALEGFYFNNSRAVNAHIDYPTLLNSGITIQKSFVEPGNPLTIYKKLVNRGLIELSDDSIHDMKYTVKDVAGNTSTLSFRIKNNPAAKIAFKAPEGVKQFFYNTDNEFSNPEVKVFIPKGNLYSDINLTYSESSRPARAFSPVCHIHNRLTPIHTGFTLSIRADSLLTEKLHDKVVIMDTRGLAYSGDFENGFVKATVKNFGNYYLTIDTIAPTIRPISISEGSVFSSQGKITLRIGDNLAGIKTYNGYIDGKWVLMEFDPKTYIVTHNFDYRTIAGKHSFQLLVTDLKNNTKSYSANFTLN